MSSREILPVKMQEAIFQRLLSRPENKICADCPAKSPTWSSIDFGVFICMNCAGAHRALGPQVTKVRSVNLDSWEPQWLEPLENVGNKIANDYYEYTMSISYKPKLGATLEELTRFVQDKYKRRNYSPKDYPTPFEEYLLNKNKKGQSQEVKQIEKQETNSSAALNIPPKKTVNHTITASNNANQGGDSRCPTPPSLLNSNQRAQSTQSEDLLNFGGGNEELPTMLSISHKSKSNIDLVDLAFTGIAGAGQTNLSMNNENRQLNVYNGHHNQGNSLLNHHHQSHSLTNLDPSSFKTCPTSSSSLATGQQNGKPNGSSSLFQNMQLKKGQQPQQQATSNNNTMNLMNLYSNPSEGTLNHSKSNTTLSNPVNNQQTRQPQPSEHFNNNNVSNQVNKGFLTQNQQTEENKKSTSINIMEMYNKKPDARDTPQTSGAFNNNKVASALTDPFFDANINNNNLPYQKVNQIGTNQIGGHQYMVGMSQMYQQRMNFGMPHQIHQQPENFMAPQQSATTSVGVASNANAKKIDSNNIMSLYKGNEEMRSNNSANNTNGRSGALDVKQFATTNNGLTDLRGMGVDNPGSNGSNARPFDSINAFSSFK